ncbi:MAG: hypothetical protein KJ060_06260 [Candidatus Hydrogenedentes bacterium]|nr:hypothetical protein [Candidatus Hydrogenedentota bacterium]
MRHIMRLMTSASVALLAAGCQYGEPDRDDASGRSSDVAEETRASQEELVDEGSHATPDQEGLTAIDHVAAREKFNEELDQLNARIDDAAEALSRMGEDAGDDLNEALAELRMDRDAVAKDIEDIRKASAEMVAVAVEAVREGLDELGDALENLSAELKET